MNDLRQFVDDGQVVIEPSGITVTSLGWYFVRGIAMVFDRYMQASLDRARFSKIL
jgi:oxygen-independent coproporphyrinogen-3 oxidase